MTRFQRATSLLLLGVIVASMAIAARPIWLERGRTAGATALTAAAPAEAPVPSPAPVAITPARMVAWAPAPRTLESAAPPPTISADAAIVVDEASGALLYEKDAYERFAPASLTKIMTALLAIERGHLGDTVEVQVDSRRMRGSTVMGLVPGERLTLEELLYGLMLPSGNDAALAIAEHISGTTDAFVALMNQRAAELGLVNTHYANPHGLDAAGHYASAFDLAVLTRVAMQRAEFRQIVNTRYREVTGETATYTLGTLNPLYGRLEGVDGVKTGFTRTARQTLVGSATREGHRLFVVVLRSPDRATDGTALLNWAFRAHAWGVPAAIASDGRTGPGT